MKKSKEIKITPKKSEQKTNPYLKQTNDSLGRDRHMKHIVVDLEMNNIEKCYKEERSLCNMEIIEIGAVVLDEEYSEVGSFKTFVKPEYNKEIDKKITKITDITTEMVSTAPCFEDALKSFLSWCINFHDDICIYQWSESDLEQILKEMHLKGTLLSLKEQSLLNGWYDFQKEFGEKLNLTNAISLKNAVMYAGIEFNGKEHDALCDARNTAALLRIVRDSKLFKAAFEHLIEILTPKPLSTSLGDLFNFSELINVTI